MTGERPLVRGEAEARCAVEARGTVPSVALCNSQREHQRTLQLLASASTNAPCSCWPCRLSASGPPAADSLSLAPSSRRQVLGHRLLTHSHSLLRQVLGHGAGMVHALWLAPAARLVELLPQSKVGEWVDCCPSAAAEQGARWLLALALLAVLVVPQVPQTHGTLTACTGVRGQRRGAGRAPPVPAAGPRAASGARGRRVRGRRPGRGAARVPLAGWGWAGLGVTGRPRPAAGCRLQFKVWFSSSAIHHPAPSS